MSKISVWDKCKAFSSLNQNGTEFFKGSFVGYLESLNPKVIFWSLQVFSLPWLFYVLDTPNIPNYVPVHLGVFLFVPTSLFQQFLLIYFIVQLKWKWQGR